MPQTRRLWRSGNSTVVTLPQPLLDYLGVKPGDEIIIARERRRRLSVRKSYHISSRPYKGPPSP